MRCVRVGSWHHITCTIPVIIYSIRQAINHKNHCSGTPWWGLSQLSERLLYRWGYGWMERWNYFGANVQLNYSSPNLIAVVLLFLIEYHKVVSNLNQWVVAVAWFSNLFAWCIVLVVLIISHLAILSDLIYSLTVQLTPFDLVCRYETLSGTDWWWEVLWLCWEFFRVPSYDHE